MRSHLRCFFFVCTLIIISGQDNSELVNDILKLIDRETKRAYEIPLATNAFEFAPDSQNYADFGTFDHIIVGCGSSGSVLASRLSEDESKNILVLEAGGNTTEFSEIPSMVDFLPGLELNWNYNGIANNRAALGMVNRTSAIPRGKALGGSGTINGLVYTRGNKRDFDKWRSLGNTGWSYADVLPYFKKSENFVGKPSPYRGQGGYWNVEVHNPHNGHSEAFFAANKELGREEVDFNGENQVGYGKAQLNLLRGQRHSTFNAFLKPIVNRPNLKVLTESFVIKILIKHKKAFGVLFSRHGRLYVAKSRRDIVLSAGAISSAQILILSGIGPQKHLKAMGIPVVEDLPVGEHLDEHPVFTVFQFSTNFTQPTPKLEDLVRGYVSGDNSLANPLNIQGIAFLSSNGSKTPDYPNIEVIATAFSGISNPKAAHFWNYNEETVQAVVENSDPLSTITFFIFCLHTKSKGSLRLASPNPFQYPEIRLNLLSDEKNEDIETLYQGIQMVLEMTRTDAFKKIDAKIKPSTLPACKHLEFMSRDYWYCQIRQMTTGVFHLTGTCRMGPHPRTGAVVDPELKVFGVRNLRVADASIIPTTISAHTNAATVMIAEKAADLIKGC